MSRFQLDGINRDNALSAAQQNFSPALLYLGATLTRTTGQTDPFGGTTAIRIQSSGGTSPLKCYFSFTAALNSDWSEQIWVRNRSSYATTLLSNLGGRSATIPADGVWTLVQWEGIVGTGALNLQMQFRTDIAGHDLDLDVCNPVIVRKSRLAMWRPSRNPRRPTHTAGLEQATARSAGGVTYGYDPILRHDTMLLEWPWLPDSEVADLEYLIAIDARGMCENLPLYDPWAETWYLVHIAAAELGVIEQSYGGKAVALTLRREL